MRADNANTVLIHAGDAVQGKYAVTFVNGKLTINPKVVTSPTITLSPTSFTYDGEAKEPAVKSVTLNGKPLKASDYSVSYKNIQVAADSKHMGRSRIVNYDATRGVRRTFFENIQIDGKPFNPDRDVIRK